MAQKLKDWCCALLDLLSSVSSNHTATYKPSIIGYSVLFCGVGIRIDKAVIEVKK